MPRIAVRIAATPEETQFLQAVACNRAPAFPNRLMNLLLYAHNTSR